VRADIPMVLTRVSVGSYGYILGRSAIDLLDFCGKRQPVL